MVLAAWLVAGLLGCNRVHFDAFTPRDAGPLPPPVDAAVVDDAVARYVAVADRLGTERCRCAGDYDLCRVELDSDWDAGGRACLAEAFARDINGAAEALTCLETEIASFESCHDQLACTAAAARNACFMSWTDAGSACLLALEPQARVGLAACTATEPDAGP